MTKKIEKALGLNSVPAIYDGDKEVLPAVISEQAESDINEARDSLYDALEKSQTAVMDMLGIAQQSQHPKAYEVLNSSIKTMADISMGIVDLHIKKQRLSKGSSELQGSGDVHNNLFVGSTAELQKMLDNMKNGNTE